MDAIESHPRHGPDATATESLIAARDLRFSVTSASGTVNILRGVDMKVQPGEAVGLVGPSGSGQTSLLMLLAGLERPSGGSLHVAGHNLAALDEDALARFRRDHVGIIFQSFHLIPAMTALENVAIPLDLLGRADSTRQAREDLVAVGLGQRTGHYPAQLSGGEQQRVALARAIVANPTLLLADEPTGNLDGATGAQIIDLLFAGNRRLGSTLVLVTHDPALAARCDRVISLADGRIVGETRTSSVPEG
jgi:putative ABC transport system ATP-binding protein